jgi:hypothetical protein
MLLDDFRQLDLLAKWLALLPGNAQRDWGTEGVRHALLYSYCLGYVPFLLFRRWRQWGEVFSGVAHILFALFIPASMVVPSVAHVESACTKGNH